MDAYTISQWALNIIFILAFIGSVTAFVKAIGYHNDVALRAVKLFCVCVFVGIHYSFVFVRQLMPPDVQRAGMLSEAIFAGTYMAINSIAATILMTRRPGKKDGSING
jgi:hypothetical protein